MATLAEAAADFHAQKRIAVVGVSRDPQQPANYNFRKLRKEGHEVFPVNPQAAELEGQPAYAKLADIPGGVDAVLVFTPASQAEGIVRECAQLGIRRVWLHRSFGPGSASTAAEQAGRELGLTLIPGGCPAMFGESPDPVHRCFRWLLSFTGSLPKSVDIKANP